MHKKVIAKKIGHILAALYPAPAIPLKHHDPYTLLIAVLLSAQCTDARVNLVTPALFAKASTPEAMVQLTVAEILELIRSCGLAPRKSQAIWELSQILINKHGGKVPASFEDLESLPGVGHKTASVVMTQAFHHPAFPVDTHIHRCAQRWKLSSGKNVKQTEKDLKALFPKEEWHWLHLRIIYFAREYCQARRHEAALCPICSWINYPQAKKFPINDLFPYRSGQQFQSTKETYHEELFSVVSHAAIYADNNRPICRMLSKL